MARALAISRQICYNLTMKQQLERDTGVPLVYQLSQIVRKQILDGGYGPNEALPTEEQMVKLFGVSRTTVRLALGKLVNEGLIRREQGRGTFVNPRGLSAAEPKPIARDMFDVKSTSNIIAMAGKRVGTRVIELEIEDPSARVAEQLDLGEGAKVFRIVRLRLADAVPLVLERIWMPYELFPGLAEDDLHDSLYKALLARTGLSLGAAHQSLRAVVASEAEASLLDVEPGAPLMRVSGVTFSTDAVPVEVEESSFRGDLMEFIVELGTYSKYARLRSPDDAQAAN